MLSQLLCTHGAGKYVQSVTRAFRLAVPEQDLANMGDGAASGRQFTFETPTRYSGHQCPVHDPWEYMDITINTTAH